MWTTLGPESTKTTETGAVNVELTTKFGLVIDAFVNVKTKSDELVTKSTSSMSETLKAGIDPLNAFVKQFLD